MFGEAAGPASEKLIFMIVKPDTRRKIVCASILAACCSLCSVSRACTLCINFPEFTHVDLLRKSHCVVLARTNADSPFCYSVKTTLKGTFDGAEIDLLVDSMTRRQLAAYPEQHVLLVQEGDQWRSLGMVTEAYLPVVQRIIAVAPDWQGQEGRERRWQFFVPLFGHQDPAIRQLAYLELGRAPYPAIRQLGRSVSRDVFSSYLNDPKYLEWRSLAILLLAQSESAEDRALIRNSLQSAERLGMTTNLSAWAAAAIEVDGQEALESIVKKYGRGSSKKTEEVEAIIAALSMHGAIADRDLQDSIVDCYRQILQSQPEFASRIADDLLAWERYDLSGLLGEVLQRQGTLRSDERRSIARYLKATTQNKEPSIGSR